MSTTSIKLLRELRDSLPREHADRRGVVRSIELLEIRYRKDNPFLAEQYDHGYAGWKSMEVSFEDTSDARYASLARARNALSRHATGRADGTRLRIRDTTNELPTHEYVVSGRQLVVV